MDFQVAYHRVAVALHGVSLRVMPQAIVAILGNNGAGKTTTLRAISGFIGLDDARVVAGEIRFAGKRIENQPPHANTARGIVLVPERDKVFPNLTVAENLAVTSSHRVNAAEQHQFEALVFQFFPALADLRPRLAGLLSGGERQMLAIGSAIVCKPELLLIDELSLGLAPVVVEDLARRVSSIRRELGITVLLVEQNAGVALAVADYGYVLETGRRRIRRRPRRIAQPASFRNPIWVRRAATNAVPIGRYGRRPQRSGLMPELAVEHLSLRFGGLAMLSDVSLHVDAGELLALIGPNGAGKTSVLNCISGIYRGEGAIKLRGQDINGRPAYEIARLGIARTFQHGEVFPPHVRAGKPPDRPPRPHRNECAGGNVFPSQRAARGIAPSRGGGESYSALSA